MEQFIPYILEGAVTVLVALIGLVGTWLSLQIGKTKKLERTQKAMDALVERATYTVLALKQVFVDDWRAAAPDGKLTNEQQAELRRKLFCMTMEALTPEVRDVLKATSLDVQQIILSTGEAILAEIKLDAPLVMSDAISITEEGTNELNNEDSAG